MNTDPWVFFHTCRTGETHPGTATYWSVNTTRPALETACTHKRHIDVNPRLLLSFTTKPIGVMPVNAPDTAFPAMHVNARPGKRNWTTAMEAAFEAEILEPTNQSRKMWKGEPTDFYKWTRMLTRLGPDFAGMSANSLQRHFWDASIPFGDRVRARRYNPVQQ